MAEPKPSENRSKSRFRALSTWAARSRLSAIVFVWVGLVGLAEWQGFLPLVKQELAALNLRFELRGPIPPAPEIVMLAIDQRSMIADSFRPEDLAQSPQLELLNSYPFPRRIYADALDRLIEAGARVVVIDLLFLSPRSDDMILSEAVAQYHDQVVLGSNFSDDGTQLMLPTPVIPQGMASESVTGFMNFWSDVDGIVRHSHPQKYASLVAGVEPYEGEPVLRSLAAAAAAKYEPGRPLPPVQQPQLINFAGPPGTFPCFPFYQIFYAKTWERNFDSGRYFRDKIVLIGPSGNYQQSLLPTPFGDGSTKMPGLELHAAALATLLHHNSPRWLPVWVDWVALLTMAMVVAALILPRFHPLLKLLILLGVAAVYLVVAGLGFTRANVILPVAAPLWVLAGGGILGIAMQVVTERLEQKRVRQTLERYVSGPVAAEVLRHNAEYKDTLGGSRRQVTVLFSDIRGFTPLSESLEPLELVAQLNEYFTEMVAAVMEHGGTLDKFIGDALMAIYGAPLSAGPADDARRAVRSACEMRRRLQRLQERWAAEGRPVLRIGIGINSGEVIVGNIGSPQRMDYTAIGDAVNVASRVQDLNKQFKTDILITAAVYELVQADVVVEQMGQVAVRGRRDVTALYRLEDFAPGAGRVLAPAPAAAAAGELATAAGP